MYSSIVSAIGNVVDFMVGTSEFVGIEPAQGACQQTTSWQDFRHHYVGISFTYHLDAKKKD